MLCIHTISILCRVPNRDADICGNVDLRIGFAQLACQLSNCAHTIHIHTMLRSCISLKRLNTESWSLSFKQAAEEKASRYRLWCLHNMPEGSR